MLSKIWEARLFNKINIINKSAYNRKTNLFLNLLLLSISGESGLKSSFLIGLKS